MTMSVCNTLRCELVFVAGAYMLLSGCIKHPPPVCGPQEPCPDGYTCSEGVCLEDDPTQSCETVWQGYSYVDGDCREGYKRACDSPFEYDDLTACCDWHSDALACALACQDHGDCGDTQLCKAGVCVSNGDCDGYFEGWYRDADGACVQGSKSGCEDPFFESQQACETVVIECPPEPFPDLSITAAVALACEYGRECCCGQCHPSIVCSAPAGDSFACLYTDACLASVCDECSADTDCAEDQVCAVDRDETHVCIAGCRDDSSCTDGARCVQLECLTLPCPAQCIHDADDTARLP